MVGIVLQLCTDERLPGSTPSNQLTDDTHSLFLKVIVSHSRNNRERTKFRILVIDRLIYLSAQSKHHVARGVLRRFWIASYSLC